MARIVVEGNQNSVARAWIGDNLDREHMIAGGAKVDAAQFQGEAAVKVVVGAAGALAAATTVPVAALSAAIPNGTVLNFGTNKFATLNAAAAAGATSLTTLAIPTALVSGDTAWYVPAGSFKTIPSGTLLGRTIAERDANTPYGVAADADDEVYLLVFDVTDAANMNDCELYRHGSVVKENLLPTFAALSSALKTKVRAQYECVKGAN